MWSSQYIVFLLPFSWAMPLTAHRGYSISSTQLREDLQEKWYSNVTGVENENEEFTVLSVKQASTDALEAPSDPTAVYSCVGSKAEDFPGMDEWLNFTQLWDINEPVITAANEGDEYNNDLKNAILEVASESKVDARLILSIIMQEVCIFAKDHEYSLTLHSPAATSRSIALRVPPAALCSIADPPDSILLTPKTVSKA